MGICPECKSKLGVSQILKSVFSKDKSINCSKFNTELTIRIKGITSVISAVFGILVGMYLYRMFNYTVGTLFSCILTLILALIVEILLMLVVSSIIGFKKRHE